MLVRFPRSGLYAINPERERPDVLLDRLEKALIGGTAVFQYRRKEPVDGTDRHNEAVQLLELCRRYAVPMIVNDDIELARRIGADGVHLGKTDAALSSARALLGPDAIVGVSCYDSIAAAADARHGGADYVAFGRFFPSRTKPLAPLAHLRTLTEARRLLDIPIVAIGGITPRNGEQLIAAGAGLLAVVDALFGDPDPLNAARAFRPLWVR